MAFADIFNLANLLSILLAARRPQHALQTGQITGAPSGNNSGIFLEDSPRTLALIDLRREVHRRIAAVTITSLDLTSTYRVTIDGTDSDYDAIAGAPADQAALLVQWAASINADAGVNSDVEAEAVDTTVPPDGTVDTLFIRGKAEAHYTFGLAVTVNAATIAAVVDGETATARAYFSAKDPNAPRLGFTSPLGPAIDTWRLANGAVYAVTSKGFTDRFDTAGKARMYVELASLTGTGDVAGAQATLTYFSRVTISPSVDERSS